MTEDSASKACSKCGTVFLLIEFTPTPSTKSGRHSWCRPCLRELARKGYDPEKARAKYQARKSDPEYIAKRKATYDRWRSEHPDRATAATLRWRESRAEHCRAVKREYDERYRQENRPARRSAHRKRQALKAGRIVTKADYQAILNEFGMLCHICGGEIDGMANLHFDHVIPLARGGEHATENIRPAHAVCNMRKSAKIA